MILSIFSNEYQSCQIYFWQYYCKAYKKDYISNYTRYWIFNVLDKTMIQKVKTYTNLWLQWFEITVEADSNRALPGIEIIGLPDAAIRESKERLRATFRTIHLDLPKRKIILNLSPSDIKKIWTSFDLPMAVSILLLVYEGNINNREIIDKALFFWELWLDWDIKRVNWLLPSVISAIKNGYNQFFIPQENIYELEYIPNITIYPINNFQEIVEFFINWKKINQITSAQNIERLYWENNSYDVDFSYIKWQIFAKRALAIAAAGLHNLIMVGAPGSGKTMLSKALQSILPPLGFEEVLEVSQIYSVVWKLNKNFPLIIQRPFRQVHHTASKISIIWWWTNLTPWEVSLAHKGVLFFDELTEFPREVLEVLRQPIEDKTINISRVAGTIQYPANFMFVWSMNPCKCGYYKDPEKSCTCNINDIKKYQNKISGPLLDRIDIIMEIPRENIENILDNIRSENSTTIREKVINARRIQQKRFEWTGIYTNAQMSPQHIQKFIQLDQQSKDFLTQAAEKLTLSPRVIHRMIKLARTIADMQGEEYLGIAQLAEAMQYRSKIMFINQE